MNVDGALLHVLLTGGSTGLVKALSEGLKPGHLDGKAGKALAFIVQHQQDSGTLPSPGDVTSIFGGEILVETGLAQDYLLKEVLRRGLYRRLVQTTEDVDKRLKANDPEGALEVYESGLIALQAAKPKHKAPTSLFSLGPAVMQEYALIESGSIGIPTPWPSLNAMTMGWWPGTNSWFAARPGTGKTWTVLVCAEHAWKQRFDKSNPKSFNILFISPEMLKGAMAERFFCYEAKLPYGQVVGATLPLHARQKFAQTCQDFVGNEGIWILDATDDLSPARIAEAIDEVKADLVVIDAAYKIRWMQRPKDRFENLFAGAEVIANWSKKEWGPEKRKIACIADSQLNREGAKKGGPKQSALALSDNLAWEADNLFLIEQSDDMKADKMLKLHASKVRRMAEMKPMVSIRWDMVTMDFTEIPEKGATQKEFKDPSVPASDHNDHDDSPGYF